MKFVDQFCEFSFFFFQAEDGIRDVAVTGVQTCALPIYRTDVVELAEATAVSKALVLERENDPRELAWQLPANRWLALAVARLPDDAAREEFRRQCTFCHQQGSWATRVQRDPEEWRKIFALMARMGGVLSTRVRTVLPDAL